MLVHLRRVAAIVAVVLVGLGLVVLDPNGPDAVAFTNVPAPPLSWMPKTVTPEVNQMTPGQWNTALNANPDKVYSNAGTGGAGASKVGTTGNAVGGVAAGVGTFFVGTGIGTGIASVVGLPTSGDFLCDWASVFGSDCAIVAGPEYAVNSDVTATPAGWPAGNLVTSDWWDSYWGDKPPFGGWDVVQWTNTVTQAPAFNATGTVTVGWSVDLSGSYVSGTSTSSVPGQVSLFVRNLTTGVVSLGRSWTLGVGASGLSHNPSTQTYAIPAGSGFDHLEFFGLNSNNYTNAGQRVPTAGVVPWFPQGHTQWVPGQDANPQRWWRTTWQCSAGAPGGTKMSDPFTETQAEWPSFPTAECDPSSVVVSMLVEQITEGVTATQVVVDWTADPGYREWADANPQCVGGGCELLLKRIDEVTGQRLSCFANPSLCTKWMADPQRDQKYECSYGGVVVALEECGVYAPTFDPGPGSDYADPDGNVDVDPAPGGETDPDAPAKDESCPPPFSWSSLVNPWWYYKATSCALSEAFVPTQTQVKVQQIATEIQTKTPVPQIASIADALTPPAAGSECLQLSLPLKFVIGRDQPLLDSCTWSDPVSQLVRQYRPLLGIVVWVVTIAPLAWWAWKTYAPGSTGTA